MIRTMRLLAAALLGGAFVILTSASPASAVGESIGSCLLEQFEITEFAVITAEGGDIPPNLEEVLEKHPEYLEEGQEIAASLDNDVEEIEKEAEDRYESCLDAPNPLLPETNEIIWGAVGFVVVLAFLFKFGYPAIKKGMNERSEKIRAELEGAENARKEAEAEKARFEASLGDAKGQAAKIIEDARQDADRLKADAQARLNEEIAQARAAAQAEIDTQKGQVMAELRGEVATIAIGAAEQVVGNSIDRNAQTQLIEDYINRVQGQG